MGKDLMLVQLAALQSQQTAYKLNQLQQHSRLTFAQLGQEVRMMNNASRAFMDADVCLFSLIF